MLQPEKKYRVAWLDYLRGFCAIGIMCYHYSLWAIGDLSVDSFLGKVGINGVSMFYILSGLTLYYVYNHKLEATVFSLQNFFIKRFFRIFPLLWLAIFASIITGKKFPDIDVLILNLTGLFGFVEWYSYIGTGVWSIGNELVFYVFFPVFLLCSKKNKIMLLFISLLLFLIYLYFAFFVLQDSLSLSEQWRSYVNPFNQIFLFLGGFLLGLFLEKREFNNKWLFVVLTFAVTSFIFYPTSGNQINIVVMWNRLLFTLICLCVCACFYKFSIRLPQILHYPLSKLGEATYSIYLLHPTMWIVVKFLLVKMNITNTLLIFILSILSTIIVSLFVYRFFERKFMIIGSKVIEKRMEKRK